MRSQPSQDYSTAAHAAAAQPATQSTAAPTSDQAAAAPTLVSQAVERGKQWINDSGVRNAVNQLPQNIKDLGAKAKDGFNGLSTTQKIVGGAILAVGLGWLASRGRSEGEGRKNGKGISRYTGNSRFGKSRFGSDADSYSPSGRATDTHSSAIDRGETHFPSAHYGSTSHASDIDGYRGDI